MPVHKYELAIKVAGQTGLKKKTFEKKEERGARRQGGGGMSAVIITVDHYHTGGNITHPLE